MREFQKDLLTVKIADTRAEMGAIAGKEIADKIRELQKTKDVINMIFAAAPSQNEVLATLIAEPGIEWEKINAFHMDEYVGLPATAPQNFGNFLRTRLFEKVPFRSVNYINGCAENVEDECKRYTELLKKYPTDIVCLGIGENGHIAFNDPPVADFADVYTIKQVMLDPICRQQQVNDGCFASLEEVPKSALTLTVPTLFRGGYLFCTVPALTKANAVKAMLENEEINEKCPATILRKHPHAVLYCDADSSSKLSK